MARYYQFMCNYIILGKCNRLFILGKNLAIKKGRTIKRIDPLKMLRSQPRFSRPFHFSQYQSFY